MLENRPVPETRDKLTATYAASCCQWWCLDVVSQKHPANFGVLSTSLYSFSGGDNRLALESTRMTILVQARKYLHLPLNRG